MVKERLVNGTFCRYYKAGSIWVSSDGTVAGMSDKKDHIKVLKIKEDERGKYVRHEWYGRVPIAKAVITCFCPPCPKDGKQYMIFYRDGNRSNCDKSNLQWVDYHYRQASSNDVVINFYGTDYIVNKDGSVRKGKTIETIHDCHFDPDMDLFYVRGPFISVSKPGTIYPEQVEIEKIMKICGFVQGDDADLKNPEVLHLDKNWQNLDASNLLWVEADDPRYIDYQKKKREDMRKRSEVLNNGKSLPDYWI